MTAANLENPIPDWRSFLGQWSREWLSTEQKFTPSVRRSQWLGYKPASERQITIAERRLGLRLPPSYKAFLRVSNGWRHTSPFMWRVLPVRAVEPLAVCDPFLLEVLTSGEDSDLPDEAYYSFLPKHQLFHRHSGCEPALVISDRGDGALYFLIPTDVTADGEWEAWMYAAWFPGVHRYPSFAHLMLDEYNTFLRLRLGARDAPCLEGPYPGVAAPDRARHCAERVGNPPKRSAPTLDELIEHLTGSNAAARERAARKLFDRAGPPAPPDSGRFDGEIRELRALGYDYTANELQKLAQCRPRYDLIERLGEILRGPYEPIVRSAAAAMLGTHGNARAIELLIGAIGQHRRINRSIVHALDSLTMYYPIPRNTDAVLVLAQERHARVHARLEAMELLSKWGDTRVLPNLMSILRDDVDEQTLFRAASAAAELGAAAVPFLAEKLRSGNDLIRAAVAAALGSARSRAAVKPLQACLEDPDANVRQRAEVSLSRIRRACGG